MMMLALSMLLLGFFCFDVANTYRQYEGDIGWKVKVTDVPFQTIDIDKHVPQVDPSVSTIAMDENIASNANRRRGPEGLNRGQEMNEQGRQGSSIPVDPGGKAGDQRGRKQGHMVWQFLKEKIKNGRKNHSNGTENSVDTNESNMSPPEADTYIVGGTLSRPRTWPWQASVQYFGSDGAWHHFCGGSLIHTRWIVTAAHCVEHLEHHIVRVVLGEYKLTQPSHDEQAINPSRMLMHAYFDPDNLFYDLAMIKLATTPTINSNVDTIAMASPGDTLDSHNTCYITGWGKTIATSNYMSNTLQESPMRIVSQDDCRRSYSDIMETQICVESATSSACTGDSGSPLVCVINHNWVMVGLASWIGNKFCLPLSPNVYTRISSFKEWVGNVTVNY